MVWFGLVWSYMVLYSPYSFLWSCVVLYGPIWFSWVPYGHHALQGIHLVCLNSYQLLNSYQNSQDIYQDCQVSQDFQ